jgi:hypothetical protein
MSNVWLAANYSHTKSGNAQLFGTKSWTESTYFDVNVFADITKMWRVGAAYSNNKQTFVTASAGDTDATNHRVLLTSLLLF